MFTLKVFIITVTALIALLNFLGAPAFLDREMLRNADDQQALVLLIDAERNCINAHIWAAATLLIALLY